LLFWLLRNSPFRAYHQQKPSSFCNAEEKLRAVEEAYGLILPSSVREWYSLNEAIPILQEADECTYYFTLQEMAEYAPDWFAQKWLNDDRIFPKYEHPTIPMGWDHCAGIGITALAITNSNELYIATHVEEYDWRNDSETLSEFILKWRYNSLYNYSSKGYQARAYNAILTESDYQIISQHFIEKFPVPPIRIFQYDDQVIHIWDQWDKTDGHTHIWLHADTPESYRDLLRRFWNIGNLSTTLYGQGSECWRIFEEFRPIQRHKSSDTPKEWGEKDILF
jgi:hypothetical protein